MIVSSPASRALLALMALPLGQLAAAEKVLGAYIYQRHGDRTAKVLGDVHLTDLGYGEVFLAGQFYHNKYIAASSSEQIVGISDQLFDQTQTSASAPNDGVIQDSGTGWLQGIYPPVGTVASETIANGTTVEAPLNGYQLIPLTILRTGGGSENTDWLQSTDQCQNAVTNSADFNQSSLYNSLLKSTESFYRSLWPMVNSTFTQSDLSFKNAYDIYDYLNVASIHNATFPAMDLLTPAVFRQLLVLANIQQYNLAYNASSTIRAAAGALLAGQVLQSLNQTIVSKGQTKLAIQFGSYGTFQSYFGLAQLPAVSVNFTGMPTYASSMAWELVTNSTSASFPPESELSVRFLFHNGTIPAGETPTPYPLFGQTKTVIPWSEFVTETQKFAFTSQAQWCSTCGNTVGLCATGSSVSGGSISLPSSSKSHGMSHAVAGVVGAMVTLGVILGLEALFMLVGGYRIAKKRRDIANDTTPLVVFGKPRS